MFLHIFTVAEQAIAHLKENKTYSMNEITLNISPKKKLKDLKSKNFCKKLVPLICRTFQGQQFRQHRIIQKVLCEAKQPIVV